MFRSKTAACLIIACILAMGLVVPAYAAVYDISDFLDYNEVDKETDTRTAYYTVNVDPYTRVTRGDGSFVTDGYGSFDWVFPNTDVSNYRAVIAVYPFGGLLYTNSAAHDFVLDVSDIMDGTKVSISADIAVRFDEMTGVQMPTLDISYRSFIIAYDVNMKFLANTLTDWKSSSLVAEGVAEVENSVSYTLPRNTFYIGIVSQFRIDSTYEIGTMHWGVSPRPVVLSVPVDMIYEQSQSMDKINSQLGNIGGQLDDLLQRPEQEKQEAQQGANDAFQGIINVVPDHSADLGAAFSGLASSMSYTGTTAKLAVPAVHMPGIDGLYDGFVLMQPQEIDFEVYFDMLPDQLLLLVQSLLTAALIIFCCKELYDTIQYVMTLKG